MKKEHIILIIFAIITIGLCIFVIQDIKRMTDPEETMKKLRSNTVVLQDYQGDTLKVYQNVKIVQGSNSIQIRTQEGQDISLYGGIITIFH